MLKYEIVDSIAEAVEELWPLHTREPSWERSPRCVPLWYAASTSRAKRPSQSDSSCMQDIRMLTQTPSQNTGAGAGEPTTKIGLFMSQ